MMKTRPLAVITAGPTREKIDPVRFWSNRSTGKMGYALAEAACQAGFRTVLISGPTHLQPPEGVEFRSIESAAEMAAAVKEYAPDAALLIMAAAVADYRPVAILDSKVKKMPGRWTLELERTEDILAGLGQRKPQGQLLVGFAAETDDLLQNAREKLERKNLDWIAANDVRATDRGFGSDNNAVTLISRQGDFIELPLASKTEIARQMIARIAGNIPGLQF